MTDIDKSIVQLGARLDEWFSNNQSAFASQNHEIQEQALVAGFEIVKALDRLKSEGMAALKSLLRNQVSSAPSDQRASLIRGFEFGAKLAHTLHEELLDTDGENKVLDLMDSIVLALDTITPGRAALVVLFEYPDVGVRASAGTYLIDLMPDQVIPLLKEIDERSDGSSASFTAHWALRAWELDRKSRFNYLSAPKVD